MTMDKDILKKAADLIGWEIDDDGWAYPPRDDLWGNLPSHVYLEWGWVKDIIAAELVRQVDALPCGELEVWVRRNIAWVEHEDGSRPISRYDGIDRTENTITAVVESKLLEKGEQLC